MTDFLIPDWPASARVRALVTTRAHGNLADHVGDQESAVAARRAMLRRHLPDEPLWLRQVHGVRCVRAEDIVVGVEADASAARTPGRICAVLTADCLPVLLCDEAGSVVAAAHAGWRGLAAGVIEATVAAMAVPGERLLAWLGPAIGPSAFEVGNDVMAAFTSHDAGASAAFLATPNGKWCCDLYALARRRLNAVGISRIFGGGLCTFTDRERFYSYRRDGTTGRMASLIWTV
ncbi:MAG TPA: peptidoglycan editing factor PgeF [Rhodocyclaceae bacterium]|nr:peptidoglycan editing factor PgeF [Rhodocyclaceae bacterium]